MVFHGNVTFEFRHAKYIGEFKTGNVEGFGSLTFLEPLVNSTSEMTKIESYFLNTFTLHGNTTIIYNNGRTFKGTFDHGVMNGPGSEWNIEAGYVYIGDYKNGLKHGNGSITHSNGFRYQGEFKNDKANGVGNITTPDGLLYYGNVSVNGLDYYGRFKDSNKTYEGEISESQMHGYGTLWTSDGNVYEGQFIHKLLDGFGVYKLKNGSILIGFFKKGNLTDFGFFM